MEQMGHTGTDGVFLRGIASRFHVGVRSSHSAWAVNAAQYGRMQFVQATVIPDCVVAVFRCLPVISEDSKTRRVLRVVCQDCTTVPYSFPSSS